jgi:hypothetical protein
MQLASREVDVNAFLRAVEYESMLDDLVKRRMKLRGVKKKVGPLAFGRQRRIHFIFERGTTRLPADQSLWDSWLKYSQRIKSDKVTASIFGK